MRRGRAAAALLLAGALAAASALAAQELEVRIVRTSENAGSVTGELFVRGERIAHTLELPWRDNASFISAIPSGTYAAHLRYDKDDRWRLQLDGVPGRSGVQLHVGNHPREIQGCVLVGDRAVVREDRLEGSAPAYRRLKRAFYGSDDPVMTPDLRIRVRVEYAPAATTYRQAGRVVWRYDGAGRWLHGPAHAEHEEVRRDLSHVYLRARGSGSYHRLPLSGGQPEEARSASGPWLAAGEPLERVN